MGDVLEWLYEVFGASHPVSSLVVVTIVFAIVGGLIGFSSWRKIAREYQKTHPLLPPSTAARRALSQDQVIQQQTRAPKAGVPSSTGRGAATATSNTGVEPQGPAPTQRGEKPGRSPGETPEPRTQNKVPPQSSIHIEQHSEGPNSPNIVGNVTIGPVPLRPPKRTLTPEKFESFVRELHVSSKPNVGIEIIGSTDKEVSIFGNQVARAFRQAGWHVVVNFSGVWNRTVFSNGMMYVDTGEGLRCGAPDPQFPDVAKAMTAFEKAGLECDFSPSNFDAFDNSSGLHLTLVVLIGKRKG